MINLMRESLMMSAFFFRARVERVSFILGRIIWSVYLMFVELSREMLIQASSLVFPVLT